MHCRKHSLCALAWMLTSCAGYVDAQDVIAFTIPSSILPNASQIMDPRFAGFGIEFSNTFSFTGTAASPNTFSYNLIANLAKVAGVPPCFRIGGNTQDNAIYQENFTNSFIGRNPNPTIRHVTDYIPFDNDIYGPELFKALGTFPAGTQFIFGLNLAYQNSDYIVKITSAASAALSALNSNLYSFEIGNEPDLYASTAPYRIGQNWDGSSYTSEWVDRASALQSQVLAPAGRPNNSFEAGTTASTIGTTFEIDMLAKDGIDRTDAVFHYNQHDYFYYIQVSGYAITRQYMMNHGNIVSQFAAWQTQQQQSIAAGKPYLLGEMAAVGPQGLALVTDVFGCALWTLDFFLYAASINVTRVLMHMTDIGNQSAWQPGTIGNIAPWVRPSYYGHIITSTLIGPNNDTTIAEIDVRSQELQDYAGRASAYVVYRGNTIYAAVVINMKEFNQTDTESSSTQLNFTLNVPPAYAGNNLTVFKLSAPGADSFKGVTWAGINYQTDNGVPVAASSNDTANVQVSSGGHLSVLVRDTQAAVIIFDSSSPVILTPTSSGSGTSPSSTTISSRPSASTTTASTTTGGSSGGHPSSSADAGTGSSGSSSSSAAQRRYVVGNVIIISLLCMGMAVILL